MLPEARLHTGFAPNGVVIEDATIAPDVEGQLTSSFREEDGRFVQRMSVAKLVENVGVHGSDLRYYYLRF